MSETITHFEEENKKVMFTVAGVNVTDYDISGLMSSAFESSGCTYWGIVARRNNPDANVKYVQSEWYLSEWITDWLCSDKEHTLWIQDVEEGDKYALTLAGLEKGLQLAFDFLGTRKRHFDCFTNDDICFDDEEADLIVQFAVFGEIVFG